MKRKLKQQVSKCAKCIKIGCVLKNQCMLHFHLHFLLDMPKLELLQFCKVVKQHTEGMVEVLYGFCWKFSSLSSSESILKIH